MLWLEGDALMVKSGFTPVTVRFTVVLCCTPPPLPVTVMGYVPGVVVLPTLMVIAEVSEPGAGMVAGLNATVVPVGTPEEVSAMALLNPFSAEVVIVEPPWPPCGTVTDVGDAEMEKSGCPDPPQFGNFSDARRVLQLNDAVDV